MLLSLSISWCWANSTLMLGWSKLRQLCSSAWLLLLQVRSLIYQNVIITRDLKFMFLPLYKEWASPVENRLNTMINGRQKPRNYSVWLSSVYATYRRIKILHLVDYSRAALYPFWFAHWLQLWWRRKRGSNARSRRFPSTTISFDRNI